MILEEGKNWSGWGDLRRPQKCQKAELFRDRTRGDTCLDLSMMQTHMIPFGFGPRICGGQSLALIMTREILVGLLRNFTVVLDPETDEHSMEMNDAFVSF